METFREIAEMHYGSEPSNEFDKKYRENRINALEKLLTEQLCIHDVVGRSEQLNTFIHFAEFAKQEYGLHIPLNLMKEYVKSL